MWALKRGFVVVLFTAGAMMLAGMETTATGSQKKPEGVPKIVHFDAIASYDARANEPPIIRPVFLVRVRGTIFVPANTRVDTKYLVPFRTSWFTTESFGPYPKGQTVNYTRAWDVDARTWNGKVFTAKLMASSSAGAVTEDASVSLSHR